MFKVKKIELAEFDKFYSIETEMINVFFEKEYVKKEVFEKNVKYLFKCFQEHKTRLYAVVDFLCKIQKNLEFESIFETDDDFKSFSIYNKEKHLVCHGHIYV